MDPASGEHYEFDEPTYRLLKAFDGVTDIPQVVADFNARFDARLSVDELSQFVEQTLATGLLERPADRDERPHPHRGRADPNAESADTEGNTTDEKAGGDYRWTLFDPSSLFERLARILGPLRPLFLLMVFGLLPGLVLAGYTFFNNQHLVSQDLAHLGQHRSYFGRLIFTLILFNLLRCLIQGTLIAHYGGSARAFGIRLRFGIIPRFFVDKIAVRSFARPAQLWTWGSNPLFRLMLVVAGTLTWYWFRGTGTSLAINAIIITQAALISFVIVSLPLRNSDGYKWLMTFFRLPLNTIKLALLILKSQVTRQTLPTSITPEKQRRLLLYALLLMTFWSYALYRITGHIAGGLISSLPMIFGEATQAIITTVVGLLMLRWVLLRIGKFHRGNSGGQSAQPHLGENAGLSVGEDHAPSSFVARYGLRLLGLAGLLLLLSLPFPYRPGGTISLLPASQQAIQAPISGKVVDVAYQGGDGTLIQPGDRIATMVSDALENESLTLREQISEQEAVLSKRQAELKMILNGARSEEIDAARAHKERAIEEVKIAEQELETARVTSKHSDVVLERLLKLSKGLIAEVDIARSQKTADVDRLHVPEAETNVSAMKKSLDESKAQLALLLNGSTAEEVEVARQEVSEAQAALRRLKQELEYAQAQLRGSQLRMPFEGYLVDAYLNQKTGSYLTQGQTFATVQARSRQLAEMLLPEYDVAEIAVGSEAEIKLMAYPTRPFRGEVVSIEPAGSDAAFGQTFNVVVALTDTTDAALKPGMTGYGKIEAGRKPLYELLTRPLVRFFMIEMWSWIL